jgi:hypothetical protein
MDEAMLDRLSVRVVEGGAGLDPVVDLFLARFPVGAWLPGGGMFDPATDGPGWWSDSWSRVMSAARSAGRGGFALVRPADPGGGAVGVHVGSDAVLWVMRLGPDGPFGRLDESVADGLPAPGMAVVIDPCAEVRLLGQW